MRLSIIAAIAENGVIGRDNDLPWRLSEDLRNFKRLTMGKPLVMGRKTFESLGKPLPGRPHIVLTRDPDFAYDGVTIAPDFDAALAAAAELLDVDNDEVMVIGGEAVFSEALTRADRLYLTEVHLEAEGDVRFPAFDRAGWRELSRERHAAGPTDSGDYSFVILDRVS